MPRRSRGGGAVGRSGFRPAPSPVKAAPPPVPHAPPSAPVQSSGGSMMGGIGSTIAQGMAFGTGSAMAHRAVDGLMGPRTVTHEHMNSDPQASGPVGSPVIANTSGADVCANQFKSFHDCVNAYGNDIGKCQFYIDMLNECRHGTSTSMNI